MAVPGKPIGGRGMEERETRSSISDQTAVYYFLRSCYIAKGQAGGEICQVSWNSGLETALADK